MQFLLSNTRMQVKSSTSSLTRMQISCGGFRLYRTISKGWNKKRGPIYNHVVFELGSVSELRRWSALHSHHSTLHSYGIFAVKGRQATHGLCQRREPSSSQGNRTLHRCGRDQPKEQNSVRRGYRGSRTRCQRDLDRPTDQSGNTSVI